MAIFYCLKDGRSRYPLLRNDMPSVSSLNLMLLEYRPGSRRLLQYGFCLQLLFGSTNNVIDCAGTVCVNVVPVTGQSGSRVMRLALVS